VRTKWRCKEEREVLRDWKIADRETGRQRDKTKESPPPTHGMSVVSFPSSSALILNFTPAGNERKERKKKRFQTFPLPFDCSLLFLSLTGSQSQSIEEASQKHFLGNSVRMVETAPK
jgi:hypothetical protein